MIIVTPNLCKTDLISLVSFTIQTENPKLHGFYIIKNINLKVQSSNKRTTNFLILKLPVYLIIKIANFINIKSKKFEENWTKKMFTDFFKKSINMHTVLWFWL